MKLMIYKGYYGSIDFDQEELIFFGKVEYIQALISYEATNAKGIKRAFELAVDDYLKMCQEEEIEPEKPFKGSFNIRTGHDLHRRLAIAAHLRETSINRFICDILKRACEDSFLDENGVSVDEVKQLPSSAASSSSSKNTSL